MTDKNLWRNRKKGMGTALQWKDPGLEAVHARSGGSMLAMVSVASAYGPSRLVTAL